MHGSNETSLADTSTDTPVLESMRTGAFSLNLHKTSFFATKQDHHKKSSFGILASYCLDAHTHQCVEDIPLMKMYGDECLELGTFNLGQLLSCHFNEHVQDLLEVIVRCLHDLLVTTGMF